MVGGIHLEPAKRGLATVREIGVACRDLPQPVRHGFLAIRVAVELDLELRRLGRHPQLLICILVAPARRVKTTRRSNQTSAGCPATTSSAATRPRSERANNTGLPVVSA